MADKLADELGHKCRQLFTAMEVSKTTGRVIEPFAMAGECALLSGEPGVERHEVYMMAKEIRNVIGGLCG